MNEKLKIESQLIPKLAETLNAEVCLGNVSTLQEAAEWLKVCWSVFSVTIAIGYLPICEDAKGS
jgi:hypothetical protein